MSHTFKIYSCFEKAPGKNKYVQTILHEEDFDLHTDFARISQIIESYLCFDYLTCSIMKNLPPQYLEIEQFIHKQGGKIKFYWTDPVTEDWIYPLGEAVFFAKGKEEKFKAIWKQGDHFKISTYRPSLMKNWPLFLLIYCFDKKQLPVYI